MCCYLVAQHLFSVDLCVVLLRLWIHISVDLGVDHFHAFFVFQFYFIYICCIFSFIFICCVFSLSYIFVYALLFLYLCNFFYLSKLYSLFYLDIVQPEPEALKFGIQHKELIEGSIASFNIWCRLLPSP